MKAIILLLLLIPISAKACSPPLDGSYFTCPPPDFVFPSQGKKQPAKEPIYKNVFGWITQALMKKIKDYQSRKNQKLIEEMISKALINYKKI